VSDDGRVRYWIDYRTDYQIDGEEVKEVKGVKEVREEVRKEIRKEVREVRPVRKFFNSRGDEIVRVGGVRKKVATLVARAFLPVTDRFKTNVIHKDGLVWNNRVENLEWTLDKESSHLTDILRNCRHYIDPGFSLKGEIWERISGSRYDVSNMGRIRRRYETGEGKFKLINGHKDHDGHLVVVIKYIRGRDRDKDKDKDGKPVVEYKYSRKRIYRLVAEAFMDRDERNTFSYVKHINGDKEDNRVDNLEWSGRDSST
jgi:hypothetical protein